MTWWRKKPKCARISELKVEPGVVIWDLGGQTNRICMTPIQCIDAAHALIAAAREAERMSGEGADQRQEENESTPPRWR